MQTGGHPRVENNIPSPLPSLRSGTVFVILQSKKLFATTVKSVIGTEQYKTGGVRGGRSQTKKINGTVMNAVPSKWIFSALGWSII